MNNFGVIEVASAKTTNAPGWAYVPDTGVNPAVAALQPANRKRAAAIRARPKLGGGGALSDLSARQEAAIRKELEQLDRDNYKDVVIPIPPRAGGSGGNTRAQSKHTPNVRKILTSQKTFANHLSDYEALQANAESSGTPRPQPQAAPTPPPTAATTTPSHTGTGGRETRRGWGSGGTQTPVGKKQQQPPTFTTEDVEMTDAPPLTPQPNATTTTASQNNSAILPAYTGRTPRPHPSDDEPLLKSRIPALPPDDELRALMTAPPMPYPELMARSAAPAVEEDGGGGSGSSKRYPVRFFCSVCGYWGRVRCIKCGTRVCALDCLDIHREECVTRYGL